MHKEILTAAQVAFLPVLKLFSKNFGLVGGTAVALHLGHRRSVDFDLFTGKKFSNLAVRKIIARAARIDSVQRDEAGQYTLAANGVRFTFLQYPFPVDYSEEIIYLPGFAVTDAAVRKGLTEYSLS